MAQSPACMNLSEEDIKKMVVCNVHLGSENLDSSMSRYVYSRNADGNHIIDLRKTWQKLQLAARIIAAVENPKDVCVVALATSSKEAPPHAQRAVLKFAKYTHCRSIAGRFTPGTFTNQIQADYFEPRVLIVSDPFKDHQPITESSYVNMPVIAFCNTNASLRNIDVAIPCNNEGKYSIALMYWLLCREVLRLRGDITRQKEWETMVDMFVYRDPEEADKQDEAVKQPPFGNWNQEQHDDQADYADQPTGAFGNQDGDWGAPAGVGEWGGDGEDH
jgi:small subunit ribosomal protein SAe